ncbi:hypothetical protein AABB24_039814 [Solanum stoloniferum]|uniref:Uncharacterized protein n=1 Tax=Solanum stoloniferum TaxID=62892 RepID=A0ABD2QS64_9SOLN
MAGISHKETKNLSKSQWTNDGSRSISRRGQRDEEILPPGCKEEGARQEQYYYAYCLSRRMEKTTRRPMYWTDRVDAATAFHLVELTPFGGMKTPCRWCLESLGWVVNLDYSGWVGFAIFCWIFGFHFWIGRLLLTIF